jgi:hypothetical protein
MKTNVQQDSDAPGNHIGSSIYPEPQPLDLLPISYIISSTTVNSVTIRELQRQAYGGGHAN